MSGIGMNAYLAKAYETIMEHGWLVQGVFPTDDDPDVCFSYTVGLTEDNLPELYINGLSPVQAGPILNTIARLVKEGQVTPHNGTAVEADYSVPFRFHGPIDPDAAECNVAYVLYPDKPIKAWQVLWPDTAGNYPGSPDYDTDGFPQELQVLA